MFFFAFYVLVCVELLVIYLICLFVCCLSACRWVCVELANLSDVYVQKFVSVEEANMYTKNVIENRGSN